MVAPPSGSSARNLIGRAAHPVLSGRRGLFGRGVGLLRPVGRACARRPAPVRRRRGSGARGAIPTWDRPLQLARAGPPAAVEALCRAGVGVGARRRRRRRRRRDRGFLAPLGRRVDTRARGVGWPRPRMPVTRHGVPRMRLRLDPLRPRTAIHSTEVISSAATCVGRTRALSEEHGASLPPDAPAPSPPLQLEYPLHADRDRS
jgi:hypothetical protein